MERRNFIVAGLLAIVYAIFPFLRPKPALYGGMDLRHMLRGNSEFRTLEVPYLIEEGVPIGLLHRDQVEMSEPICFAREGNDWFREEPAGPGEIKYTERLTTGTTGGTRVTPVS